MIPNLEIIIPKEVVKIVAERILALSDEDRWNIRKYISSASKKVTAENITYFIPNVKLIREFFAGFYTTRRIK